MSETYFLTGALGCIGSWVTKLLLDRGDRAVVFDKGDDPRRIRDLLPDSDLAQVEFVEGDIAQDEQLLRALESSGARRIIHLAGLQVPFCKADPLLGARVNVLGTLQVFEAARRLELPKVVYASSAAVYGPEVLDGPPDEGSSCVPTTHYGVYKAANEGNARIYWQDCGLSSVGLRPLTVYGVGRDQGLTSGPTKAMKAAVLGRPYTIAFSGATDFNYVADTAAAFIACADRAPEGARVYNLHGESVALTRIVEIIESCTQAEKRGGLRIEGPEIPIPPRLDGRALMRDIPNLPCTPLEEGVAATMQHFSELQDQDRLRQDDLDS